MWTFVTAAARGLSFHEIETAGAVRARRLVCRLQHRLQLVYDLRIGRGDVTLFRRIGLQVVELERGAGTRAYSFPVAVASRIGERIQNQVVLLPVETVLLPVEEAFAILAF